MGLGEAAVLSGSVSLIPRSGNGARWFRAWVGFLFLEDQTYVTGSYITSVRRKRADLASSTVGDGFLNTWSSSPGLSHPLADYAIT